MCGCPLTVADRATDPDAAHLARWMKLGEATPLYRIAHQMPDGSERVGYDLFPIKAGDQHSVALAEYERERDADATGAK